MRLSEELVDWGKRHDAWSTPPGCDASIPVVRPERCLRLRLVLAVLLLFAGSAYASETFLVSDRAVGDENLRLLGEHLLVDFAAITAHGANVGRLPLPGTLDGPVLDGKLDDACWQQATVVSHSLELVGGPLGQSPIEYRYCRHGDRFCLAVSTSGPCPEDPRFRFSLSVANVNVPLEVHGKRLRYHHPTRKTWEWLDDAVVFSNGGGGVLETAIPMSAFAESNDWRHETVRLHMNDAPIPGGRSLAGRQVELFPAEFSLALDATPPQPFGRRMIGGVLGNQRPTDLTLRAELFLIRPGKADQRESLAVTQVRVRAGQKQQFELTYPLGWVEGACGLLLTFKHDGKSYQHVMGVAGLPVSSVLSRTEAMLQSSGEPGSGDAQLDGWYKQLASLKADLKRIQETPLKEQVDTAAWQQLYQRGRALKRDVLLSQLPADFDKILFVKRRPYTAGGRYFTTHYHFEPGKNNLCVYSYRQGTLTHLLDVPDTTAVRDPNLNFEADRIVFVMRGTNREVVRGLSDDQHDVWSIYEVRTDGSGLRRLTKSEFFDLEPIYLPDGRILFGSLRSGCWGCCTAHSAYNFFVMDGDGSNIRRFTANYLYDVSPSVMHDGRIIFLRWVHEDKPGNHINALWTVNPDGTQLAGYFGMHSLGCTIEAQSIAETNEVVCIDSGGSGHWRLPQNGNIAILDLEKSRTSFAHVIPTPLPFGGHWGFKTPYPLGKDLFLTSFGHLDFGFGIYVVDRDGNMELIYKDDSRMSAFNAVPLKRRSRPAAFASQVAGHSADTLAIVTLHNVYEGLPGVEPGTVKSLRIVQVPDKDIVHNGNSAFADQSIAVSFIYRMVRRVIGTVPVHEDGSARFEVPPNHAIYFQALDADGLMVQTMRDTTAFQPGERISCIGCHEHRGMAPPPSLEIPLAMRQPPARPEPLPEGVRGISFPKDVQPILDRACVECHDLDAPAGGAVLSGDLTRTFNVAYETLMHRNRDWGHSLHSQATAALVPVIKYVVEPVPPRSTGAYASQLFRKYVFADHYDVKLSPDEIRMLAMWVDLSSPYYDDWHTKRFPGGRNIDLSAEAHAVIQGVMSARCNRCHEKKPISLELGKTISLNRPEQSGILRCPLLAECCRGGDANTPVFKDTKDPDYRKILEALEKERERIPLLAGRDGLDMP